MFLLLRHPNQKIKCPLQRRHQNNDLIDLYVVQNCNLQERIVRPSCLNKNNSNKLAIEAVSTCHYKAEVTSFTVSGQCLQDSQRNNRMCQRSKELGAAEKTEDWRKAGHDIAFKFRVECQNDKLSSIRGRMIRV